MAGKGALKGFHVVPKLVCLRENEREKKRIFSFRHFFSRSFILPCYRRCYISCEAVNQVWPFFAYYIASKETRERVNKSNGFDGLLFMNPLFARV